jgi:hypothetical protein
MVDASDLKSAGRKPVRVRLPPALLIRWEGRFAMNCSESPFPSLYSHLATYADRIFTNHQFCWAGIRSILRKCERKHAFLNSDGGQRVAQIGRYLAERIIQTLREFLGVFDPPEQAGNLDVLGDQLAALHR